MFIYMCVVFVVVVVVVVVVICVILVSGEEQKGPTCALVYPRYAEL